MLNSYQLDEKLEPILRQIEKTGVRLDVDFLTNLGQKIGLKLTELEENLYSMVGHKFNLNSPLQLAKVLYGELKISPEKSGIKKRKTHHSTSANDLQKIRSLHKSIDQILIYRELAKLKNTYIEPLPKLVDREQRLHTTYAADTATGRLSSKNPNLQNIPAFAKALAGQPAWGNEIRKAFIAEKGYKLIVADYSQIELRIAAHFSSDMNMLKIFQDGLDIHTATARELGVDRRTAKVINFGILYGMSAYGVSETLKIPPEEAQVLIDRYFNSYTGLAHYIQNLIQEAHEDGFVETLLNRRRYLPEINSKVAKIRRFGERAAINTPMQGTAAEIIKLAMLELNSKLNKNAKMIMQIHDELVFEVSDAEIDSSLKKIKNIMENIVKLKIPILVNLSVGDNWAQTKEAEV